MHKTESQPFHSKSFLSSWMSLSLSLLWWQTCFTKSVSFSYLSQNMRLIWENMCNPLLSTFCGLFSLMNYHSFLFVWIVLHFSYFSRSLFIAPNIKLGRGWGSTRKVTLVLVWSRYVSTSIVLKSAWSQIWNCVGYKMVFFFF